MKKRNKMPQHLTLTQEIFIFAKEITSLYNQNL